MSKKDDELNDFVDEVTDGTYNLSCVEVIFKLVKQIQTLEDERIKNIVAALAGKQLENSMMISSKIPWTRPWKEH
jgi:hypothetical protein